MHHQMRHVTLSDPICYIHSILTSFFNLSLSWINLSLFLLFFALLILLFRFFILSLIEPLLLLFLALSISFITTFTSFSLLVNLDNSLLMILTFFFLYFKFLLFFNLSNLFFCSLICNFNASTSLDRFLYFLAVLDFLFQILSNCRFISEELLVPLAVPLIDPLGIVF